MKNKGNYNLNCSYVAASDLWNLIYNFMVFSNYDQTTSS